MESNSLFNPGFLGSNFQWWIGQVVNDKTWKDNQLPSKHEDPSENSGWGYRYKVRIIGLHDRDEESIPSDQLPWAQVMYPITAGGGQAGSFQTPNIRAGNFVFGFFLDGSDMQVPVIMGVLGNNSKTKLSRGSFKFTPTSGYLNIDPREIDAKPPGGSDSPSRLTNPVDSSFTDQEILDIINDERRIGGQDPFTLEEFRKANPKPPNADRASQNDQVKAKDSDLYSKKPATDNVAKESSDSVQLTVASDIIRQEKACEKVPLRTTKNQFQSSIKNIQTDIEKATSKINKYMNAITSYTDAITYRSQNPRLIIRDASKVIARHMKPILNSIQLEAQKTLNKEMRKAVSALPSSERYLMSEIKEEMHELTNCLFGQLSTNLSSLIEGLLTDAIKPDDLEKRARDAADNQQNDPFGQPKVPEVPICSAEVLIGDVISYNYDKIDDHNNNLLAGANEFLKDMNEKVSSVLGVVDKVNQGLGLLGALSNIPNIKTNMAAAMLFNAVKPEIFGCDFQPDFSVNDEMSMCAGGNSGKAENVSTPGDLANRVNKQIENTPNVDVPKEEQFNQPVESKTVPTLDDIDTELERAKAGDRSGLGDALDF